MDMWPRSVFWVVGQYAALYTFYRPGTSNISRWLPGLPVSSVYARVTSKWNFAAASKYLQRNSHPPALA
jgi:hypothetical protein